MRAITLSKGGLNKVRSHHKELKQADVEDSLKSLPPGEWCVLKHPTSVTAWICFVNPLVDDKYVSIHAVAELSSSEITSFNAQEFIRRTLTKAYANRQRFTQYEEGGRIFYGHSDGLPGLIVDQFLNKAIVQINTAGLDVHREFIKKTIEDLIQGQAYFLDNAKYREKEFLPTYDNEPLPSLTIRENGIEYHLRSEVLQKVGFYYDHRENRVQLIQHLKRIKKNYAEGVDLFCYLGAWGLSALKGGVEKMSFVDQGDFSPEVMSGLGTNGFQGRGEFFRSDVFKFLDDSIQKKKQFDVILCDPPAFAKSQLQKNQALEGYSKLHRKVLRLASPGGLIAFSSCTHYVSHEEFQKNVLDAAMKENKKIQLIYTGMQGWDHPVSSLTEKANYIKSFFYLMES